MISRFDGILEDCETTCGGCGKPVKYDWQDGFISSPDTVLVADWLFHVECWKDPEPAHGGQMEGVMAGTNDDF